MEYIYETWYICCWGSEGCSRNFNCTYQETGYIFRMEKAALSKAEEIQQYIIAAKKLNKKLESQIAYYDIQKRV